MSDDISLEAKTEPNQIFLSCERLEGLYATFREHNGTLSQEEDGYDGFVICNCDDCYLFRHHQLTTLVFLKMRQQNMASSLVEMMNNLPLFGHMMVVEREPESDAPETPNQG